MAEISRNTGPGANGWLVAMNKLNWFGVTLSTPMKTATKTRVRLIVPLAIAAALVGLTLPTFADEWIDDPFNYAPAASEFTSDAGRESPQQQQTQQQRG